MEVFPQHAILLKKGMARLEELHAVLVRQLEISGLSDILTGSEDCF